MRRSHSVSELSPGEFAVRLDQLIAVYAAAMRPPAELLPGRKSIMAGHAVNPGFRAITVIDDGSGEPVGFGYGFHGGPGQWWHNTVRNALTASRGAAVAPERTALLSTRDADSPARRLYRGTGFVDLLTDFHFFPGGEPPYAVMGAELPLRNRPGRRSGWPRSHRPLSPRPSR
jgi:hypothetical protein